MRIENWSLVSRRLGTYVAPELARVSIQGRVFGHPRFDEGEEITTSYLEAVSGCEVTTHSGSIYWLGSPSDEYTEWCRENRCRLTPDEPIRL